MISKTLSTLAAQIQKNGSELARWFEHQAQKAPPPFYCSIDLRDSGHKIVPVDSNLYPAGFNNICPEDLRTAPAIFRQTLERLMEQRGLPKAHKILILPESHTQNVYYLENLYYLQQLIEQAGFEVRLGWYGPLPERLPEGLPKGLKEGLQNELKEKSGPFELISQTGKSLNFHPIHIQAGVLSIQTLATDPSSNSDFMGNFIPDFILLNNDFSSAYPKSLDEVRQPIVPSHSLGWHSRKKSEHFKYYNQLAAEFAQIIQVDPWLIQIDTEEVSPVNFSEDSGTEKAAQVVERMLERIRHEYAAHQVTRKPFVFVKNNAGTYGMGIMVVHSADELRKMNRRTRNKMSVGKNLAPIESIVVQEGIPTATLVSRLAAEPVIYLLGTELIGGFLRTNPKKGDEDNLNSQGMVFRKLCMSDLRDLEQNSLYENLPDGTIEEPGALTDVTQIPIMELVYGSIARISALATGIELAQQARGKN